MKKNNSQKHEKNSPQKGRTTVDWNEVHRSIEDADKTINQVFTATPEKKKKILKDRAKRLAHEPESREDKESSIEVVEFLLASERYAVESEYVREVCPLKNLTPLPLTPLFVMGIINVRGQILSVIDIKKFYDLPEKGITDLNKVIIVHNDDMEFGILADAVTGFRSIPMADIQPPLPTLTDIRADYLKGVTKESMVILDLKKMLSDKRIIVHEEV